MDISPAWVSAGGTVFFGIGAVLIKWVSSGFHAIKTTQKLLFEKHDEVSKQLQDYKLHVAETYVNREILKEQLAPINKTLENIQDEMREMRKA
jgi:hypothetical protein